MSRTNTKKPFEFPKDWYFWQVPFSSGTSLDECAHCQLASPVDVNSWLAVRAGTEVHVIKIRDFGALGEQWRARIPAIKANRIPISFAALTPDPFGQHLLVADAEHQRLRQWDPVVGNKELSWPCPIELGPRVCMGAEWIGHQADIFVSCPHAGRLYRLGYEREQGLNGPVVVASAEECTGDSSSPDWHHVTALVADGKKGLMYVADDSSHCVYCVVPSTGNTFKIVGTGTRGSAIGKRLTGTQLSRPNGLALIHEPDGPYPRQQDSFLLVGDSGNDRILVVRAALSDQPSLHCVINTGYQPELQLLAAGEKPSPLKIGTPLAIGLVTPKTAAIVSFDTCLRLTLATHRSVFEVSDSRDKKDRNTRAPDYFS